MSAANIAADAGKCDQVWERIRPELNPYPAVRAARAEEMPTQGDRLSPAEILEFIKDELNDRCYYVALSRKARNKSVARLIASVGCEEFEHAKKLRAAYFIMTGERACPDTTGLPEIYCLCDGLRARYIAELHGAETYRQAATRADDENLKCLLNELAGDEAAHACCMWELLGSMQ